MFVLKLSGIQIYMELLHEFFEDIKNIDYVMIIYLELRGR